MSDGDLDGRRQVVTKQKCECFVQDCKINYLLIKGHRGIVT